MAAELGLLSLTQIQELSQAQQKQQQQLKPSSTSASGSWMWNPKNPVTTQEDDDSWEVRAFAEDTGNGMGTTWPPRSYTCTFCRREFKSAQALGGHMNVHRRDRARLHQAPPGGSPNNPAAAGTSTATSTLIIPTQEFVTNGGLCLLYSLPNPNGAVFSPTSMSGCMDSPSTLLSISQCPTANNLVSSSSCRPQPINFSVAPQSLNSSLCHSSTNTEPSTSTSYNNNSSTSNKDAAIEELDLELRLGRGT